MRQEAESVTRVFPDARVLASGEATREAALEALPASTWVHFACHGKSDGDNPSASHLLLSGLREKDSSPLSVLDVSRLRLRHAELAYLSACSTATNSPNLADENIHIVAAFQLAGYHRVIGTLWPIYDKTAVGFADEVYAALTAGTPDASRAAIAVHRAARRIRDKKSTAPHLWAPYIHAGI